MVSDALRARLGPFARPTRCGPDCRCACFFDAGECSTENERANVKPADDETKPWQAR